VTLPDIDTVLEWRGRTVVDRAGEKIGKFQAQPEGDDVRVPFDKEDVESAPEVDSDRDLSQDEEAALYAHYGLSLSGTSLCRRRRSPVETAAHSGRSVSVSR
jgi:hypothetical protein